MKTASKKKIEFNVTATDIDNGVPLCSELCPVARAINRKLRRCTAAVGVGAKTIYLGKFETVPMPDDVYEFAAAFDEGKKVKPFRFTLEVSR